MARVIQATDKRANIVRTSLSREKRLVWREDKRHVCLDALLVKPPYSLQTLPGHRALHNNIGSKRGKVTPLPDHSLSLLTHNLKIHGSLNKSQNVCHKLDEFPVLLRDKCRVGGYPVQ